MQLMLSDAAVGMHRGLNVEELAIVAQKVTGRCAANTQRLFQDRFEHRSEAARRGVDDLQYLGGRGLPLLRFLAFGFALGKFSLSLGKLTLQIGYELLGIG